jgi:Glycosyltransferase family 87
MTLPRKQLILNIVKTLIVIFGFISLVLFFYQSIRNYFKFSGIDLTSYIQASQWFFNGENPYQEVPRPFIYPQFILMVVYPLNLLQSSDIGKAIGVAIWSLGLYISLFLTYAASWKMLLKHQSLKEALIKNYVLIALMTIILHPFLQDEFINGQINLFVLGCTAGFFFMLQKDKQFLAALFLAAAISLKIAPGLCILYVVFTKQYRSVLYIIPLVLIFNLAIPYLINNQSLEYYIYFVSDVMPKITGLDFEGGFRSFSLLSTVSHLFKIHWNPLFKMATLGILAIGLFLPIYSLARNEFKGSNDYFKFVLFASIITIIPITFPMSEAHHLLLQTIPFLAVLIYWKTVVENSGTGIFKDKLSIIFSVGLMAYHIGHVLKPTPIRLFSIIIMYIGMVMLMRKMAKHY